MPELRLVEDGTGASIVESVHMNLVLYDYADMVLARYTTIDGIARGTLNQIPVESWGLDRFGFCWGVDSTLPGRQRTWGIPRLQNFALTFGDVRYSANICLLNAGTTLELFIGLRNDFNFIPDNLSITINGATVSTNKVNDNGIARFNFTLPASVSTALKAVQTNPISIVCNNPGWTFSSTVDSFDKFVLSVEIPSNPQTGEPRCYAEIGNTAANFELLRLLNEIRGSNGVRVQVIAFSETSPTRRPLNMYITNVATHRDKTVLEFTFTQQLVIQAVQLVFTLTNTKGLEQ